jgi:hypothetical protein
MLIANQELWSTLMQWVTWGINILIVCTWKAPSAQLDPSSENSRPVYDAWFGPSLMWALGLSHVACTSLVVFTFYQTEPHQFTLFANSAKLDASAPAYPVSVGTVRAHSDGSGAHPTNARVYSHGYGADAPTLGMDILRILRARHLIDGPSHQTVSSVFSSVQAKSIVSFCSVLGNLAWVFSRNCVY